MLADRYILSIATVLLISFQAAAGPDLFCAESLYDFGIIIGKDQLTHEFVLTNKGNEAVRIAKIKNCCGVQSSIEPMVIAPGSNAVCRAVFTTRNRYGVQDKQILIGTHDRRNPYFELKITGTLQRPIEFTPRYVRLGNLLPDAVIKQSITATNMLDQTVTLGGVICSIDGIAARVVESGTNSWAIALESSGSLPVGKLNGRIDLLLSTGKVSVPILGTVKPIIQVVPEKIQISAASKQVLERYVMLRGDSGHPFELLSYDIQAGTVEVKKMSGHCWRLKLELDPEKLISKSFLRIVTTEPLQKELRIPLEVR